MSKMRAYRQQFAAAAAAAAAGPGVAPRGPVADQMLGLLAQHRAALKGIKSTRSKAALKRQMLPEYTDYVAGVLSADSGAQDTVLVTVCLWMIDAGLYRDALPLGLYCLRHDLEMPEGWKRDLPSSLLEMLADAANNADEDSDLDGLRDTLAELVPLAEGVDMHDEIRGKVYKVLGDLYAETDPDLALSWYSEAKKCGKAVTGAIRRAEKASAAAAPAPAEAKPDAEQGAADTASPPNEPPPTGGDPKLANALKGKIKGQ